MSADEDMPGDSADIARKASHGLRWSLAATVGAKFGSFAMGLVLARLLSPADFGAYAIALAATGFVIHINDVGLMAATVQWRGKLRDVAPTATTMALFFSLVVYGAFWFGAPAFARLAGNADAAPAIRLLTLVIVIDGITAIRVASLQRSFQQQKIAIANAIGLAIQIPMAIVLAASGAGAYAFVLGQLGQATVTGVLVFVWARLPTVLGFERTVAVALLRYGAPLAVGLGMEALLINADYVIVGQVLGATMLGFYLLAFNVSSWVANTLGTAIRYVSVAGFSRLSEQDGALSDGVRRSIGILLTSVVPIVAIMGALAEPLIAVLYGDRWAPAAAALSFLMALAMIRLLAGLVLDALMGAGATRSTLVINTLWAIALVPALLAGTLLDGIRGTAIAHVVIGVSVALPASAYALHRAGVGVGLIGRDARRPLVGGAAAIAAVLLTAHLVAAPLAQLALGGVVGMLVYGFAGLSRGQRHDSTETLLRLLRRGGRSSDVAEAIP